MTVNEESCRAVKINGKVYHSVQEMIERIVDLEKANEWHSLKKLPNEREDVLLFCRGVCGKRVCSIGYWTGKNFVCIDGENDVLAWKELPELPKGV